MEKHRHNIPGTFPIPEIEGRQNNPLPGQAHETHTLIPGALVSFQKHSPIAAWFILIEICCLDSFFCIFGNRFRAEEGRSCSGHEIKKESQQKVGSQVLFEPGTNHKKLLLHSFKR